MKSRSEVIEYRVEHFVHRPAFHAKLTALYERAGVTEVAPTPLVGEISDTRARRKG